MNRIGYNTVISDCFKCGAWHTRTGYGITCDCKKGDNMSGGALDYISYTLERMTDECYGFGYRHDDVYCTPFRTKEYLRFYKHLRKVSQVLHDIEWAMSGDIDFEDANKSVKKFLNSIKRNKK